MGIKYTPAAATGDITGVTAGVGLSGGGASGAVTLTLDLSELSTVTPADGDSFATLDSDGANEQKTTTTALATLFAGTGLTASSSVISVDAAQTQITSVGTIGTGVWQGTAIASGYIAADAITGAKIADDAIDSEHYTDGSIDTAHIADNQVTLAKMAGLARGKVIYGDASGDPAALAVGTAGYVLATDGTDLAYTNSLLAADYVIGEDAQTKIDFETANEIHFDADNAEIAKITSTGLTMSAGENVYLGDGSSLNIATPLLAGADHTYSGISAQMLAGAAITAFNLVCIHTTTQEVIVADASAVATARAIGIAPADISDTATGTVLLHGFIRDDSWGWTTGAVLYLSETAGSMTETAPTTTNAFVQAVGIALEPDVVFINPSLDIIKHA